MIRALLATAAVSAAASAAYGLYKAGRLDGLVDRLSRLRRSPPPLALAYEGANASRPAPAHPWPTDPKALRTGDEVPDAA